MLTWRCYSITLCADAMRYYARAPRQLRHIAATRLRYRLLAHYANAPLILMALMRHAVFTRDDTPTYCRYAIVIIIVKAERANTPH